MLEKKWPQPFVDYEFINCDDPKDLTLIKIIKGKYKNIIYYYGKVGVDNPDAVPPRLKFNYYIIESGEFSVEELHNDKKFITQMGDILVSIFDNNILMKDNDEQIRNNDSEELDLQ